jgi:acyl-coenzyme A synthetase/AMP-(fatty) acid ligase/acyl carrier protein
MEMYGALFFGAKLIIIPLSIARDPELFVNILQQEMVSVLNQTPSSFYSLSKFYFEKSISKTSLRYVIFGGEALSPNKLLDWFMRYPYTSLINMYGITETTVHVTYKVLTLEDIQSNISNIGIPIPTLSCYVLDRYQRIAPIGIYGELYVGGAGLCRGYLNRTELTMQKFVKIPLIAEETLYRSGDKVRMLDNGDMEYAGRLDQQVKIRGYRVELGEIEKTLESHPVIESAIVITKVNSQGYNDLIAYLVSTLELDTDEIRLFLSNILPSYMLPSRFIRLDKLPLNNNGKIDRKSLENQLGSALVNSSQYIPPTSELERKLVDIWSHVLNIPNIGITDTFLRLGGHSLLAVRITSALNNDLNIKISIATFFKYNTIQLLSNYIQFITSVKHNENDEYVTLTL